MTARWTMAQDSHPWWEIRGWPGVRAWCTGRRGGVSLPPYDTLNLSGAVGDLPAAVAENRRRATKPGAGRAIVFGRLVHGTDVAWITGQGEPPGPADILLSRDEGVVLAMTYADCVPLLWWAPRHRIVGIAHAGWRGTTANVPTAALRALRAYGVDPGEVHVAIGPAIGPCCYQVDEPVATAVRQLDGGEHFLHPDGPGHWRLDLPGLNGALLTQAGVPRDQIVAADLCTACHPVWFFSHRRDHGRTGRQGGFICLTPE